MAGTAGLGADIAPPLLRGSGRSGRRGLRSRFVLRPCVRRVLRRRAQQPDTKKTGERADPNQLAKAKFQVFLAGVKLG